MTRLVASILLLAGFASANAAPVDILFRVTAPANTPVQDTLYIAGNFQGWNPGSPPHALAPLGDGVHEITLAFEPDTRLEFKFTRGDWAKVEKGPSGEEIANRIIVVDTARTLDLTVASWADLGGANHTLVGDVTDTTVPGLFDGRRVWIYLPPGYHESENSYPVLVMLDGQNVFDTATSFAGEWEMDETCEALIAAKDIEPIIVVAVDNGGTARIDEYTPFEDVGGRGGGGGIAHLQEIVDTLIPWVRANYRTQPGPENTGFGGSSLGGLMAAYAAFAHGDTFGRIAALSPSVGWAGHALIDFVQARDRVGDSRAWIDMGTMEWGSFQDDDGNGVSDAIDDLRLLRDAMVGSGYVLGVDLVSFEDEGAVHNEGAWRQRLPNVLRFLFPAGGGVKTEETSVGRLKRAW